MDLLKKKPNTPNLDGLDILGMVNLGTRSIAIAPIGMVEVGQLSGEVVITWTTGHKITLSAEEWQKFEEHLKEVRYAMMRQQGKVPIAR